MSLSEAGALALVECRLLPIMADYPDLNPNGWGEPYAPNWRAARRRAGKPEWCAVCEAPQLLNEKEDIAFAIRWLLSPERVVLDHFRHNTYGLKHVMERDTGKYIDNGSMIAAFLILGMPILLDDFNPLVQVAA